MLVKRSRATGLKLRSMTQAPTRRWPRSTHRRLHLLVASALGTFVYSPLRTVPEAVLLVQLVVFPLLVASGLWLWQGHRLGAWWRERRPGTDR